MTENSIEGRRPMTSPPWEDWGVGRESSTSHFSWTFWPREKELIIACTLRSETGWVSATLLVQLWRQYYPCVSDRDKCHLSDSRNWKCKRDRKSDQRNCIRKSACVCSGQKVTAQLWSVQWEADGEGMCPRWLVCWKFQWKWACFEPVVQYPLRNSKA